MHLKLKLVIKNHKISEQEAAWGGRDVAGG